MYPCGSLWVSHNVGPPSDVNWFINPSNYSYLRIINHSEIGVMFTNLAFTNWGTILQVPSQEIVGSILGAAVPVLCHYMSLYVAIVRGLVMSQLIVLTLPTAAPGRVNSPCHRLYY